MDEKWDQKRDQNQYGPDQPGYDTDTFGTVGQKQEQRREGAYQQDTGWRNVPPQGNYRQNNASGGAYRQDHSWQGAPGYNGAPYQQGSQPGNGFGIASMVLGILSLVFFCTCLDVPLAILSIVFAIIHLNRKTGSNGFAIAGIITSVIAVILTVIMIVVFYVVGINTPMWDYSTTLPFEQFIEGDGLPEPGIDEWEDDSDDPGEFMNHHGQEQSF